LKISTRLVSGVLDVKNLSLAQAEKQAKALAYKLTCGEGLRNAALIAKLAARRLKKDLEKRKT